MAYYVNNDGLVTGPFDGARLKLLAGQGNVTIDSMIAQSEHGPWVPARNVRGLFNAQGQASTVSAQVLAQQAAVKSCSFCGETILAVAIKCKHCGEMLGGAPGLGPSAIQSVAVDATGSVGYDSKADVFLGPKAVLIQLAIRSVQELGWTLGAVNESLGIINFETGMSWGSFSGVSCTVTIQAVAEGRYRVVATGKQNVRGGQWWAPDIGGEARKLAARVVDKMRELCTGITRSEVVLADRIGGLIMMCIGLGLLVVSGVGVVNLVVNEQGITSLDQGLAIIALDVGLPCGFIFVGLKVFTVGFVPLLKRLFRRGTT